MGQAIKNKVRPSNTEIEVQPRTAIAKSGGTQTSSKDDCLDFLLEDCTTLAESLQIGDSIIGDFARPRIRLLSPLGIVGYAPESSSRKILQKLSETRGKIIGLVTEFRPPRGVRVEVCI